MIGACDLPAKQQQAGALQYKAYILKCWARSRVPLQHLAQHVLCVWRDANVLEESWVLLKGQRGVPQQHAHYIGLTTLLAEQPLTCTIKSHSVFLQD